MNAKTMKQLRQIHHYVGVFLAPMILLFAISGALQTFRLQEVKGYGGPPPGWIVWMASVHKDQALPKVEPARVKQPERSQLPAKPMAADGGKKRSTLPLKIFVILLSAGLALSTILGLVIALQNRAMRRVSIVLLLAGTAVPLALLFF